MAGYIYLIGSPKFHWYKIGRSKVPHLRVKNIGVLLPFKIELIATWFSSAERVMERELHEKYDAYRINGEWFLFDDKQVQKVLSEVPYAHIRSQVSFTNIEKDAAPSGQIITIKYKADLSDEEREIRKQKAIAERQKRNSCA